MAKQDLSLSPGLTPHELKLSEHFLFARSQDRHFLDTIVNQLSVEELEHHHLMKSISRRWWSPGSRGPPLQLISHSFSTISSYSVQQKPFNPPTFHILASHSSALWPPLSFSPLQVCVHMCWELRDRQDYLQELHSVQKSCSQARDSADGSTPCQSGQAKPCFLCHRDIFCRPLSDKERAH